MSLLANVQAQNIEWAHKLNHVGQGEEKQIFLRQRQAGTNKLVDFLAIEEWKYSERGPDDERLPPQVLFELHIAEELLTKDQVNKVLAVRHGKQIFEIVQIGQDEPGILEPRGSYRFWRIRLAPLEELP